MKTRLAGASLLLLCSFIFFAKPTYAQNWDINLVRSVNPEGSKSFVFRSLSTSVYPTSLAIPAATYLYVLKKRNHACKANAYEELGSIVIAGIATAGSKTIFNRQRPYEKYTGIYPIQFEHRGSFPSAHAAIAFATATTLSIQYKKWYIVLPAYVWASSCGFSRIYLGEHYPTDVLAGAAVGAGSALVSHWLTQKLLVPIMK